jgi:crossover junction endodeoxyribonuclease RusA
MSRHEALVDLGKTRTGGSPTVGELLDGVMVYPNQDDVDEWILDFDYQTNPLSMNGSRGNHHAHARKVKEVRNLTRRFANLAGIPALGRAQASITWYVLRDGRRDPINLSLLVKAMCDGLVDHGVTTDDTPDLMDTPTSRIILVDATKHDRAWMELSIKRWAGPQ